MSSNTRPVKCRRCNLDLAPLTGCPVPDGLPAHIGDLNKRYLCPACYTWAESYIENYKAAAANYRLIGRHIAALHPELVVINRCGSNDQVHSQAAAWAVLYQTIQEAGLYCDRLSNAILDSLALKHPRTFDDFRVTVTLCKFTTKTN